MPLADLLLGRPLSHQRGAGAAHWRRARRADVRPGRSELGGLRAGGGAHHPAAAGDGRAALDRAVERRDHRAAGDRLLQLPADDRGVFRRRIVYRRVAESGCARGASCRSGADDQLPAECGGRDLGGRGGAGFRRAFAPVPHSGSVPRHSRDPEAGEPARRAGAGRALYDPDVRVRELPAHGNRARGGRGSGVGKPPAAGGRAAAAAGGKRGCEPVAAVQCLFLRLHRDVRSRSGKQWRAAIPGAGCENGAADARGDYRAALRDRVAGARYQIGATAPGQSGYQSVLSQLPAAVAGHGIFY